MTHFAIGMPLKVILVVLPGLPEFSRRHYFRKDLSGPQSGRVNVSNGVACSEPLLIAGVEDGRADTPTLSIALTVLRRRIVNLEEELQEIPVRSGIDVVNDLHR